MPADLALVVNRSFGGLRVQQELAQAASSQFGSGWAWLVREGDWLSPRRLTPIPRSRTLTPLVTIDVGNTPIISTTNRRADYAAAVMDKLMNWEFALENFRRAAPRRLTKGRAELT